MRPTVVTAEKKGRKKIEKIKNKYKKKQAKLEEGLAEWKIMNEEN